MGFLHHFPENGGAHPGPPPPAPKSDDCAHAVLRVVRRNMGKLGIRFGVQCVKCMVAGYKLRDGRLHSDWFGIKRFHEVLEDRVDLAAPYADPSPFYWERRTERQKLWHDWYEQYLRSADWRILRQRILLRDRHKCKCGRDASQVHHLTYERVGYEHPDDLISICRECHEAEHGWPQR